MEKFIGTRELRRSQSVSNFRYRELTAPTKATTCEYQSDEITLEVLWKKKIEVRRKNWMFEMSFFKEMIWIVLMIVWNLTREEMKRWKGWYESPLEIGACSQVWMLWKFEIPIIFIAILGMFCFFKLFHYAYFR